MHSGSRKRMIGLCSVVLLGSAAMGSCGICWAGLLSFSGRGNDARSTGQSQQRQANKEPPWNTTTNRSADGYQVTSTTNLDGAPAGQIAFAEVGSGVFHNWRWTVKADPSLLPSWNVYANSERVKKSAALAGNDWSYPVFEWKRGFERVYLLASYLLGREPAPLNATILLVPEGQEFESTFDQAASAEVPITLGFHFPADTSPTKTEQAKRDTTVLQAIMEMAHQYSRVLVDKNLVLVRGTDESSRTVNKEADGACWAESADLVFAASGGHFRFRIQWNQQTSGEELAHHPPSTIPREKIGYWASLRQAESISGYLEMRRLKNRNFSSKNLGPMNAVLSVCRAMTQSPVDLAAGPYPPSQILDVPFFPDKLK